MRLRPVNVATTAGVAGLALVWLGVKRTASWRRVYARHSSCSDRFDLHARMLPDRIVLPATATVLAWQRSGCLCAGKASATPPCRSERASPFGTGVVLFADQRNAGVDVG